MFALRPLGAAVRQQTRRMLRQEPAQMQQQRGMAGGDDGVKRYDWWDAPTNPNVWKLHQLAWWTTGFYASVYYLVAGGSKKEETK